MELANKLSGMKEKLENLEQTHKEFEKETNNKLKALEDIIPIIEKVALKLDKDEGEIEVHSKNLHKLKDELSKKIESNAENLFKLKSDSKDNSIKFTNELTELKKDLISNTSEIEKEISKTASNKEMESLSVTIDGIKKTLKELSTKDELNKVKKTILEIDNILEKSLKDTRNDLNEIKKKMLSLVGLENMHKHFSDLKLDVTTTGSELDRKFSDLKTKVDSLFQELERLPAFQSIENQNKNVRVKVDELETKMTSDFEKTIKEIEKLGEIFPTRQELTMGISELESQNSKMERLIRKIDEKHTDLEKQIVLSENQKDDQINAKTDKALNQIKSMFEELMEEKSNLQDAFGQFEVLKEQIITTQRALVEMNARLKGQKY